MKSDLVCLTLEDYCYFLQYYYFYYQLLVVEQQELFHKHFVLQNSYLKI